MKSVVAALLAALGIALLAGAVAVPAAHAAKRAHAREYVVAYKSGVSLARAKAAVRASGGRVVATRPERAASPTSSRRAAGPPRAAAG